MRKYAQRIGADFFVLRESTRKPPHLAKYDLLTMANTAGYQKILYVDADVYIRRGVPNIFDHYENALFNELPQKDEWFEPWQTKTVTTYKEQIDPEFEIGNPYYNTGVMVFNKDGLRRLCQELEKVQEHKTVPIYYEQHELNLLLKKAGLPESNLHERWNTYASMRDLNDRKLIDSYFIHTPGMTIPEQRVTKLQQIVTYLP